MRPLRLVRLWRAAHDHIHDLFREFDDVGKYGK